MVVVVVVVPLVEETAPPGVPEELAVESVLPVSGVMTVVSTGTSLYLSLLNIPKPAIGMLETFFNGDGVLLFVAGGVFSVTFAGGVSAGGVGFLPNGLKLAKKFVPGVLPPGVVGVLCSKRYRNTPKIIRAMIIIKSVKFLLDIYINYLPSTDQCHGSFL